MTGALELFVVSFGSFGKCAFVKSDIFTLKLILVSILTCSRNISYIIIKTYVILGTTVSKLVIHTYCVLPILHGYMILLANVICTLALKVLVTGYVG